MVPLDDALRDRILAANAEMAANGLRVLGVGYRLLDEIPPEVVAGNADALEDNLVIVGMIGMIDPARPEVRDAVRTCREAGIKVKMITGDHPATAAAIARELGIADEGSRAIVGVELNKMDDEELSRELGEVAVFARVAPEHKLRIVKALQSNGEIVAMTGDGVNDAPALKQAEIGVAMGITGTDVTKEAGDMVLRDDNFATIVAAVSEGRVVYANIRKFIRYLLTGNIAEIIVMLVTPFFGMPLALLPLQILWINLLTDGLPALALGIEPAESNVMRQPPRSPTESILGRSMGWQIGINGLLLALLSTGVGYWAWRNNNPDWQTMIFTTLTFGQMAAVLSLRSDSESFFRFGIRRNPLLIGAVALTVVLQLLVTYQPFLQELFETTALTTTDLLICIGLGVIMLLGVEVEKLLFRRAK
jgi:Ca2+-transporting ATPase